MKKNQKNHQNVYRNHQNSNSKKENVSRLLDYEFSDEEFGTEIDQLELQKEETRKATQTSHANRRKKGKNKTA